MAGCCYLHCYLIRVSAYISPYSALSLELWVQTIVGSSDGYERLSRSANPGVYAIVGMGSVVAGITHGMLSAMVIVYEMTDDYHIILPIMIATGLSSIVS